MKSKVKYLASFIICLVAMLAISGCTLEITYSADRVESNMEKSGYEVESYKASEYQPANSDPSQEFDATKFSGLTDVVVAIKNGSSTSENDVALVFVFKSNSQAKAFYEETSKILKTLARGYVELNLDVKIKVGVHENTVLVGTDASLKATGIVR